jgi:hypothetical protein
MTDFLPGDRVLYRDGDRFAVARVDVVKDRFLTVMPYNTERRAWSIRQRRVARGFVLGSVPKTTNVRDLVVRIEALRNQREALRQQANRWLEDSVRQLAVEAG